MWSASSGCGRLAPEIPLRGVSGARGSRTRLAQKMFSGWLQVMIFPLLCHSFQNFVPPLSGVPPRVSLFFCFCCFCPPGIFLPTSAGVPRAGVGSSWAARAPQLPVYTGSCGAQHFEHIKFLSPWVASVLAGFPAGCVFPFVILFTGCGCFRGGLG